MRVRKEYRSASKEAYKRFCIEHPGVRISYSKFSEIIYEFSYRFRDHLLETGEQHKLPHGMGILGIQKRMTRRLNKANKIMLPVDWAASRKHGHRVYNFNHHTEGYRFKWLWINKVARFKFASLWNFKPLRVTSRKLAEYLNKPDSSYQHIYRERSTKS